jgi:hypothetical protein
MNTEDHKLVDLKLVDLKLVDLCVVWSLQRVALSQKFTLDSGVTGTR